MLNVIYEDNHLLVVEKPVNILSQGDNTNDDDMVNLLKKYLKEKYNKPGNVFVGLVHRLDRPVGGIMIFLNKLEIKHLKRLIKLFFMVR